MSLTLLVTKNCNACKRVESQLNKFIEKVNIELLIMDINDFNRPGIAIVPALLIGNELFSYGDVDENRLLKKLAQT